MSLALLAVVAQQLVPAADGINRYPALEIMMATDAVRNLIRKGDDHQLRSQLTIGRAEGMMTMEQSLAELARAAGRIHRAKPRFAHSPRRPVRYLATSAARLDSVRLIKCRYPDSRWSSCPPFC
jgi:Tfp pilus assembly pilus retraction ATPase PilT